MSKKIGKVLFLTIDFPPMPGGMSRHSNDVARALKQAGEDIVVVSPGVSPRAEYNDAPDFSVLRLDKINSENIFNNYLASVMAYFFKAFFYCLSHKVKAVYANTWTVSGVAALILKKILGLPYFIFANGLDVNQKRVNKKVFWLMRLTLKNADKVIAISNFTKGLLGGILDNDKVVVVNPVVDLSRFDRMPSERLSRFQDKLVILTVARLVDSKGHEDVIRAMPEVIKIIPQAIYCIVGEGRLLSRLKSVVFELDLVDNVVFEGSAPEKNLLDYYYSCDVFIMPSREIHSSGEVEGFGIVFLEAGACAKPVIGSRSGGISDAVLDGITGILVEPGDVHDIALSLIRLLADNDLARSLGANARKRVEANFNLEQFGKKIKGIFSYDFKEKA